MTGWTSLLIAMAPTILPIVAQPTSPSVTDSVTAVRLRGRAEARGAPAGFEAIVAIDGRFWWRIDGELGEEVHFDGSRLTVRDANGAVAPLAGRARGLELAFARLLGAVPAWGTEQSRGEIPFPDTRTVATVSFPDDSTHRITVPTLQGIEELVGTARRTVAGVTFSSRVVHRVGDFVSRRVAVDQAEAATDDAIPPSPRDGGTMSIRFRSRTLSTLETKSVPAGLTLVRIRWNGEPGWWILDTGASDAVADSTAVATRAAPAVGRTLVTSMLGQTVAPLHRIDSLDLGPVHLDGLTVAATDLSPLGTAIGERLVGIIGFDLLARAVVEFLPGHGGVRIGPPDAAPAEVPWQSLVLLDRHPTVPGVVDGEVTGRLRLDTGAGPALMTNRWVSEETDLLTGRSTQPFAGAPVEAVAGTVDRLDLAGHPVRSVLTLFVTGGTGQIASVFNDRDLVGNVGAPVLARFRMILDYSRDRLALIPAGKRGPDTVPSAERTPPLRARPEDIPELVDHFLQRRASANRSPARSLTPAAIGALLAYPWPGNVRQLQNVIERVVAMSDAAVLGSREIREALRLPPSLGDDEAQPGLREARAEFERAYISSTLSRLDGRVMEAAEALGINRSHLWKKMQALGIQAPNA
ncbi:MAG: aspartyl protease family protein [Gemmatimonadales bacterium]